MKQVILFISIISIIFSEDITNDSLSVLIKERTDLILEEVYIDPLSGKRFGIELSPLYTMFFDDALSGSFSNFRSSGQLIKSRLKKSTITLK